MGPGVPIPAKSNSWVAVLLAWCCILMDSVAVYSPDRDTLHGAGVYQFQPSPTVGW